jgi:type I restriction enzyme R subunit
VDDDRHTFVAEQQEKDLSAIIEDETLKPDETRKFVEGSFRDGAMKTTGTDIDKILSPVSRFSGSGRTAKKQGVIEKLL